jgi:hypothetical protein
MQNIPTLSSDLIEELQKAYPQRCPKITDTEREIWMYAGAAALVQKLVTFLEQDKDNIPGMRMPDNDRGD